MVSRNGIYYDLSSSVYKFQVPDTQMVFVFSSDMHRVKFVEKYIDYRKVHNLKLKVRYKLDIRSTVFADLTLYSKVETRGFLVVNDRGQDLCKENIIIDGERATALLR